MATCSKLGTVVTIRGEEYKVFDEVSADILVNEPLFTNAVLNWGFGPNKLWQEVHRLGKERVLEEVRVVQRKAGIANKGAYLRKRLENMQ